MFHPVLGDVGDNECPTPPISLLLVFTVVLLFRNVVVLHPEHRTLLKSVCKKNFDYMQKWTMFLEHGGLIRF